MFDISLSLIAALGGLIVAVATALKYRSAANTELLKEARQAQKSAFVEMREARKEIKDLYSKVRESNIRKVECEKNLEILKSRVTVLESTLPILLANERISLMDKGIKLVFDHLSDPLVVSSSVDAGLLIWVNKAFCDVLGRTREEILELGWKNLVHPDDILMTKNIESQAWTKDVISVVNRYKKMDGTYVHLRWYAPKYSMHGVTIALAKVIS